MRNLFLLLSTFILLNTTLDAQHFLTTWNTANPGNSNSTSITIPTNTYAYNYDVDWENDGTFDDFGVTGNITHDYGTAGIYQVAIRGTFPTIRFPSSGGDNEKITSIDQWGNINWKSFSTSFKGCSNMGYTATDAPDLADVTSLTSMFEGASSFNGDLSTWNTSNITYLNEMFRDATFFNGDVSTWDISSVTSMNSMFRDATSFNGDLSTWNTSSVTYMMEMFRGATSFNGDLSNWNTSNVVQIVRIFYDATSFNGDISTWNTENITLMYSMFGNATSFNGDLSNWNTSSVTSMYAMFQGASSFNGDLSNWNTDNVTDMVQMFAAASSFNSDLSNWNTENVTSMSSMFTGASSFNRDLNNWNTNSLTNTRRMFEDASSFNSDLGNWNTANVTNMESMFKRATSFNGDLSTWNTVNVTDMGSMFRNASSFNRDLSSWDIANVTNMNYMFISCGLSTANYDNTLIGWAAQTPPMGLDPYPIGLIYCDPTARDILINTYNWTFTGDAISAETDIEVQGNNMIITEGDDTPSTTDDTDYGSLNFGEVPVSKTFTINNTGSNPLEISGLEISGVNAADFTITSAPASTVAASSSTTFTVEFTPASDADNTATVEIYSSDCDQTKFTFDLKAFVVKQPFLTTWNTANDPAPNNTAITIPTNNNYVYNYDVDWNNDGTFDDLGVTGDITHDYGVAGTYQVAIRGTFPAIRFNESEVGDNTKIISIDQWGDIDWKSMEQAFADCPNLGYTATDTPDLDDVTSMTRMFFQSTSFNGDLSTWNTANVTNMNSMFSYAASFNGNLSTWNTSNVVNMSYMFEEASSFDGDLSTWNTGNVTNMSSMFYNASSFTSDLSTWNTSNVTKMDYMFFEASSFNSDLSTWDISNVTNMSHMFNNASSFDSDLGSWDMTNSNNPYNMLNGCGLSLTNYDNTLIGWAAQSPASDAQLGLVSGLIYCEGAIARDELINTYDWDIYGDSPSTMGAEIDIKGNNIDIVNGDDTPSVDDDTDFGSIAPNASTTIIKTFTITNPSAISLDILNVAITGTDAANFSITTLPSNTVASGANTTFTIEFTPNTIGSNNATVEITNSDCGEALYNFDLAALVFDVPVSEIRGQMLELNGTDEYVNINNVATAIAGETRFTLEAWINADATQAGNDRIISINTAGGGNVFLLYLDAGVLSTFDGSDQDTYGTDLRGTGWHHVAVSHNNSRDSVYLDGKYMGTKEASVSAFSANNLWSIGQEYDSGPSIGDFFKGKMDEIRIWKDVRTKKEIQENMHLTFPAEEVGNMENLVAYYQFDNDDVPNTADGVKDILGNHGTSIGGIYTASEIAVGAGVSVTKNVTAAGVYDFGNANIELTFAGATLPNNDIVATRITSEAVKNGSANEMTNTIDEYWIIRNYGTNTGLDAEVKFNFNDGFINDNIVANHTIHKRGSNQYEAIDWSDETASVVSSTAGDNYIKSATITSFSQFYISATTSPLPVELLHFNAKRLDDNTVQLDWQTASETNNKGFEIERLDDEKGEFEKIAFVEGNGTTSNQISYQHKDDNNYKGTSYYRLKQLDFDGKYEYSNIVSVILDNDNNIGNFYPNPSSDGRMNLDYYSSNNNDLNINIFDLSGKVLHSQTAYINEGNNALNFDFSNLNQGAYLVELNDGENRIFRKIVIR